MTGAPVPPPRRQELRVTLVPVGTIVSPRWRPAKNEVDGERMSAGDFHGGPFHCPPPRARGNVSICAHGLIASWMKTLKTFPRSESFRTIPMAAWAAMRKGSQTMDL